MKTEDQQPGHRGGGEHRVHRGAPVLLPVDVGEVQDQRVFVEHQRSTDPEADRGNRDRQLVAAAGDDDQPDPETSTSTTPNTT